MRPPASTRSSTTSSASPTTTPGRGALAEGWAERGVPVDPERVETNFVQIDVAALGLTTTEAIARLGNAGVGLSGTVHPGILRAVTHLDIDDEAVARAIELVPEALELRARA